MTTTYYVAASLDGFIADADGGLDWLLAFGDPSEVDPDGARFMAGVGAVCMGAGTYRWLLDHPAAADAEAVPGSPPTWVVTHRTFLPAPGVRFASGDVRPLHAAMSEAADGKDLWVMGGGDLAGQFHDAGLLDELAVAIMPVALGAGVPLLPRAFGPMTRLSCRAGGRGAVLVHYALRPRRDRFDATQPDQAA